MSSTAVVSTSGELPGLSTGTRDLTRTHYRTRVSVGVIDDAARFVFTRGQCHSLAAAISETTGWPVIVLIERVPLSFPDMPHDDTVIHCYVESPDGWWIDIHGEHDPAGATESATDVLTGDAELHLVRTDAAGARSLATYAGSAALGLCVETPLLPTCMPVARAVVPAILNTRG